MSEKFVYGVDPRPVPLIARVAAGPDYTLIIDWVGGNSISVDLSGWIGLHGVEELRPLGIFSRPEIGDDRDMVRWAGNDDLSIDSIHLEQISEQQRVFAPQDLIAWQERHRLTNREAADLMGVSASTWLNYRSGTSRIPHGIAIACRAMDRDPVVMEAHYRPRWSGRTSTAAE